jgi:hypothetical protein
VTTSGADARIQQLAGSIYELPLSQVRDLPNYPDLASPLHLVVLLLDADTEIAMQGVLGFLENSTGRHLSATRQALGLIGAVRSADLFAAIESCMRRHRVTWESLRRDFSGTQEFEVTSFSACHPNLEGFADEVGEMTAGLELFNKHGSTEETYSLLCAYVEPRLAQLDAELAKLLSV